MPSNVSAGLLMYSFREDCLHVLLAHPGGPFFVNKDMGAWTIPKGLVSPGEDLLAAARREFMEETGFDLTHKVDYLALGCVTLKSRKTVHAWAFRGEWEVDRQPRRNTFLLEWPPKSGRQQSFPEVDRAEMYAIDIARQKINAQQLPFLDRLCDLLEANRAKTK
jgi:predicted NUDIX family NTP pyrophosphohydrolase